MSLKKTLNENKDAFQSGDKAERKMVQKKLKAEIKEVKKEYREKV